MSRLGWGILLTGWMGIASAGSLDELLHQIEDSRVHESQVDEERKARFLADKSQQQKLLNETKAALAKAEAESKALREQFAANETRIKDLGGQIRTASGDLDALFAAVRQFAASFRSDLEGSLVSSQFPDRAQSLESLVTGMAVPSIPEMEKLWISVLQEMTESGKVARFKAEITDAAGARKTAEVYRIGAFTAIADDRYLRFTPANGQLMELPRQPDREFLAMAKALKAANGEPVKLAIDPSRGTVLEQLQLTSAAVSWLPKNLQSLLATSVDVAVIGLLFVASIWAFAVAFERWLYFRKVDVRVFPSKVALETELTRHMMVIGTVAANAPFVGLLGTVLGIMLTFHKMGMGKTMDVHSIMIGLSVALKATAMGLLVAIPCVVLNNILRRRIRELTTAFEVSHGS
ncbi:MAG: TonB-system energizer ExbB [Methylococcaceae bacterium]|nr:TonB-system energizer ExbB [Methylococcaceae bacterium]